MTNSNRNFLFAYVLLVALPLCGLAGVLRSGRSLSAPLSVGGAWRIASTPDQLAAFPCGHFLAAQNAALNISQSGKQFTLSLPNSAWASNSGAVEGNTLTATLLPATTAAKPGTCSERSLTLTAVVDPATSPRALQGELRAPNCPTCAAVVFRALRDEVKAKETH